MNRLNFTLDDATVELLNRLSEQQFSGNKSLTVRAALEALAANNGHDGWVITGYSLVELDKTGECHHCGTKRSKGDVMYRPVFERGRGSKALRTLPAQVWLDCPECVQSGDGCVVTH